MPPKKNSTRIKPSEGSTMTHEEEEALHDISKLQEQVHQISLSQRATKNEMEVLKKCVEAKMDGVQAKMDGMEAVMEAKMDDMKYNMENMKNDLKTDI